MISPELEGRAACRRGLSDGCPGVRRQRPDACRDAGPGQVHFCGLCAEADTAIRMTNVCELAARHKADLVTTAEYDLGPDGTQGKLLAPRPSPLAPQPAPSSPSARS